MELSEQQQVRREKLEKIKSLGIDGKLINWIERWLTGRYEQRRESSMICPRQPSYL